MCGEQNKKIVSAGAESDLTVLACHSLPIQVSFHLPMSASNVPWTREQFYRLIVQDGSVDIRKYVLLHFEFLAGLHCLYVQGTFQDSPICSLVDVDSILPEPEDSYS